MLEPVPLDTLLSLEIALKATLSGGAQGGHATGTLRIVG